MLYSTHQHGQEKVQKISGIKLIFTIILNVLIALSQLIAAIFINSQSLLSDAIHNFSDVLTLIISYFAYQLSKKPANKQASFGYGRAETLATFINAFLLLDESKKNDNIKASFIHLFSDLLTSLAVLFGGLSIKLWGWFFIDSILSIFISIYLITMSLKLLINASYILMEFTPKHLNYFSLIQLRAIEYPEVESIFNLHIWQLSPHVDLLDGVIQFKPDTNLKRAIEIKNEIKNILLVEYHIEHSTLEIEIKK